MNTYSLIYSTLKDRRWHSKDEFLRPWSSDLRRLQEMKENGWLNYKIKLVREKRKVLYSLFRITDVTEEGKKYFKGQRAKTHNFRG